MRNRHNSKKDKKKAIKSVSAVSAVFHFKYLLRKAIKQKQILSTYENHFKILFFTLYHYHCQLFLTGKTKKYCPCRFDDQPS